MAKRWASAVPKLWVSSWANCNNSPPCGLIWVTTTWARKVAEHWVSSWANRRRSPPWSFGLRTAIWVQKVGKLWVNHWENCRRSPPWCLVRGTTIWAQNVAKPWERHAVFSFTVSAPRYAWHASFQEPHAHAIKSALRLSTCPKLDRTLHVKNGRT